jgi:hypothetical protein
MGPRRRRHLRLLRVPRLRDALAARTVGAVHRLAAGWTG